MSECVCVYAQFLTVVYTNPCIIVNAGLLPLKAISHLCVDQSLYQALITLNGRYPVGATSSDMSLFGIKAAYALITSPAPMPRLPTQVASESEHQTVEDTISL